MLYGVYESLDEAKQALSEISNKLQENELLQITSGAEHANRIFLIPAFRVHYVVCEEVERPRDRSN
jgi:DNA-binding MurR/RpiR family transcriptional regulator